MVSIAQAFVSMGQGYLDQDKAISIAKAEASEKIRAENAAIKKSFSDQAIKMWGKPEYMPTIKKMPMIYQNEKMISTDPVGWMNEFRKVYAPPEDTEDISKHPLYSAIYNVFNDDKNKSWLSANKYDFQTVTQSVPNMEKFVTESLEMTQKTDDLTDSQKEALRYASSQASEPEQRAASQVAKTFGMAGEKDVMFTRGNIKKYPELADQFIHATMEMLHEIHDAEKEAGGKDGTGKADKNRQLWTNGVEGSSSYVEFEVDTTIDKEGIGHNDWVLYNFLESEKGKNYLNILHSLNETERSKWDSLVEGHFKAWMDQRIALDTGWGDVKNLKGSKAYMSLPPALRQRARDAHLNSERTNWYLLKGEIAESGSGVAHDAIIIPKGEWSSAGIADWEMENNDKLSAFLGHQDKSTWYKNHPDLLLVNQKIKNRAFEIADNDLFKVATRVGDTETYTSLFTKPNISTFSDDQVVTLLDLLEDSQDLSRDEQIQTLAILFGENPEKFMDEANQGGKVVPLTKTFLETVFQKEQDKILSAQDKKNQRGIQTAAGKTRKLLLEYKGVFDKPGIDPGAVGTVKELYYLVWENDSSMVNRVFSGKAGKGRRSPSDGKEMEESERVLKLLMKDPTALLQSTDDGEYYYMNSAGKKVIVEKEVIDQMGRELDAAYSESYYYGRKKALELFLGYTMARSFDDQGRISDKDLDMQLKTFRGDWKSNIDTVTAAIDVGLDMVDDQIAIANGLLADGIEYEVIGPDGQKHITVWDINKMKATQLWRQLLTRRDADGETIQQKRMYTLFNIYNETLAGAAHKIKKEEGTTFMGQDLYRVTQTQQVDGKDLNPTGMNKRMYAYKVGPNAWVKVPWNRLKEIKFGDLDSSGEVPNITPFLKQFKFADKTISDVYHSNGEQYYDKELTKVLSAAHKQEINQY